MAINPKLTVLHEKFRGKVFVLDKDVMSIGRRDDMDIVIKDDSISSHHADFIRNLKGSYVIRDNQSTNGTRVNDQPITSEHELKGSDVIQLGGVAILYDAPNTSNVDLARTHTIALDTLESKKTLTKELQNLNPFANIEQARAKKFNKFMLGIIGFLSLAVLAAVVYVSIKLIFF